MTTQFSSKQLDPVSCETQGHLWGDSACIMCKTPKPKYAPSLEFAMRQVERCRNYAPTDRVENEDTIVTLGDEIERLQEDLRLARIESAHFANTQRATQAELEMARVSSSELERYKRALYQANGQLMQLDKEPVKLDYSADEPKVAERLDKTYDRILESRAAEPPPASEIEAEIIDQLSKRTNDRLCVEALALIQRLRIATDQPPSALQQELAVTNKLLDERNRLLDAIPECPQHGRQCVPHAIEWVQKRATVPPSAGGKVCDDKLEIIHEHGQPHGIRDRGGYLFFFPRVSKYSGQEERYRNELAERFRLADFLLAALQSTSVTKSEKP